MQLSRAKGCWQKDDQPGTVGALEDANVAVVGDAAYPDDRQLMGLNRLLLNAITAIEEGERDLDEWFEELDETLG